MIIFEKHINDNYQEVVKYFWEKT